MKRILKYLGGEKDPNNNNNLSHSHSSKESESSSTTAFQQQIGSSSKKGTITHFSCKYYNYFLFTCFLIIIVVCM